MSALKEHRALTMRLEALRAERDAIDRQITVAAATLHRFEKERGNLIGKAERRARWDAMQPALEAIRQTPEWQAWRERFVAERMPNAQDAVSCRLGAPRISGDALAAVRGPLTAPANVRRSTEDFA